jgi:hypothetical protein
MGRNAGQRGWILIRFPTNDWSLTGGCPRCGGPGKPPSGAHVDTRVHIRWLPRYPGTGVRSAA